MPKEMDDRDIRNEFVRTAGSIQLEPDLWERIDRSTRNKRSGHADRRTRVRLTVSAAALAILIFVGFTPGGKALAEQFAESIGIHVFSVTTDKGEQIKRNGVKIDVKRFDAPVQVNELELSPSKPDASSENNNSGSEATLQERDESGVVLERKIDTKKVRSYTSDGVILE